MKRRFARAAVAASTVALALPALFPEAAQAAVDDQRREVESIVDELDDLHERADILAEDWAEAEDNLRGLDEEVVEAQARIAVKEAELDTLRGDLSAVAVRTFIGTGADVLGPLFTDAQQYGEGLRRDQFSRVALSVGTATTDDLDELIDDLANERADLQRRRDEVDALKATIEQKRQQTEQLTAEYEQRHAEAEARLGDLIRQEEERRAAEAFARLQAEFAEQQAAAASGGSSGNGGGGGSGNGGGGGGGATPAGGGNSGGDSGGGDSGGGDSGGGDSGGGDSGAGGGGSTPAPAPAPSVSAPSVSAPPVSGLAGVAVSAALGQQGVPYQYATSNPGVSFDCSGLTHYAWGQAGVYLPRNSRAQAAATPRVPAAAAQPGDLIFYYTPISHVGIYLGNGQLVHAPNTGTHVKVSSVSWGKVTAVGRPG